MKRINSLILLLLIPFACYSQVNWPFPNPATQESVVGSMGEVRGGGFRFHKGVDLTEPPIVGANGVATYPVHANNGGTVTHFYNGIWDDSFVRVGTVYYYHMKASPSILNGTQTNVQNGGFIGTMLTNGPIHVHLQENNTNYLNQNLSPYVDGTNNNPNPPVVITTRFNQGYEFYRNGITRTASAAVVNAAELNTITTLGGLDFKTIYSKIDIAADITDRRVGPNGAVPNNAGALAPYSYKYSLVKFDNSNISNPFYDYSLTFDQVPNNAASNFVFHRQSVSPGVISTHVITSHARTAPYDRYFNTLLRKNVTDNFLNTNLLNARHISEAAYPDDKYRIYIDAFDVDFNNNPNNSLANPINAPVLIDNFLPYLTKVEVVSASNGITHYQAEWNYTNNLLALNKPLDLTLPSNAVILKVNSSEPMDILAVTVNNISYPLTSTSTSNKSWEVTLPVSTSGIGTQILSFYGRDYTGNELLINPTTLPTRLANGTWPSGAPTGEDTWHRVKFSGVGGTIFGADFNNGGYCIPNNGNKRSITGKIDPTSCLQVCFQDNSTPVNNISSWFWEFGDFSNSTSSSQNPSFQYTSPGTYNVKLTITNAQNQTRTTTKSIIVEECSSSINAQITANTSSGVAPLLVDFTDITVGDISNRTWNVPNGVQFISGDENSVNVTLLFPYAGGPQQVSLTIEDQYGDDTTSNIIVVNTSSQSTTGLLVDYSINGGFNTGNTLTFDSEVSQGCNNFSYQWTFNDYNGAHYSTLPTTTYSFPVPGDYTVKLCVTDNCGNQTCKTKNVAISNFQSGVTADMWSSIGGDNWTVLKGTEITFYDNSEPEGDILYGSWFWDYENSSDAPDLFYWYTNKPATGNIKHTYNQVGTYKVRLYVGESVEYAGDFQEVAVTVVDEFDYLEIPVINEVHRQVFNNRQWSYKQVRNFGDYMLTMHGKEKIEIYKRNGYDFNLNFSLNLNTLGTSNVSNGDVLVSGYDNQFCIASTPLNLITPQETAMRIYIFEKTSNDWQQSVVKQVISIPGDGSIEQIKLHKNTLVIARVDPSETYRKKFEVYEQNTEGLYHKTAQLINPLVPANNPNWQDSFANEIDVSDNYIIGSRTNFLGGGGIYESIAFVYEKTDHGWVNSLPVAKLFTETSNAYGNGEKLYNPSISDNLIVGSNGSSNDINGLLVYDSGNGFTQDLTEDVILSKYFGNIEDNSNDGSLGSPKISENNNFILGIGQEIRDFKNSIEYPNPGHSHSRGVLRLFYKEGNTWEGKNKEDLRLYPLGIQDTESLVEFFEFDNKLVQFAHQAAAGSSVGSTNYENTVIYTYDLNGIEGVGACYQDLAFENKQINELQNPKDGKNIIVSNTILSENARVVFRATDKISFKVGTKIKAGAIVKASIVDCNEIE